MMDKDRTLAVGTRLRMVREDGRLTQQEVADRAGVSRNTIIKLEAHEDMLLSTLLLLSDALEVAPHVWLLPDRDWQRWYRETHEAAR